MSVNSIRAWGVCTHNLKNIEVEIPHGKMSVLTGVSGSGKSSLGFDTLYAEGQRRYLESLSTYARQFLNQMPKPPIKGIENILASIALRQQSQYNHPRSTVAHVSELLDFMGHLYAQIGEQHCVKCGSLVRCDSLESIEERLKGYGVRLKCVVLSEVRLEEGMSSSALVSSLVERGYQRLWLNGEVVSIDLVDFERLMDLESYEVVIDRLIFKPEEGLGGRAMEAVEAGFGLGNGSLIVELLGGEGVESERLVFDKGFKCVACRTEHIPLRVEMFNPNSTLGACPECTGFGSVSGIDWDKVIPDKGKSIRQDAVYPLSTPSKRRWRQKLFKFCEGEGIDLDVAWRQLSREDVHKVLYGTKKFGGVQAFFDEIAAKSRKLTARLMIARFRGYSMCPSCEGACLSASSRRVFVNGKSIADILGWTVERCLAFFEGISLSPRQLEESSYFLKEIVQRLQCISDVGLGYLGMSRQTRTLSGGEMQRLHLSSGLGRGLEDTLYVLDEPTAGLHSRDTARLMKVLKGLRDMGNTLVVIEHDPEVIREADRVVELGPLGGSCGGEIIYEGDYEGLCESETPSGRMLRLMENGGLGEVSEKVNVDGDFLKIIGARKHNLQGIDVRIPLHCLVCVTGVSGSGKSSLIRDILYHGWELYSESGEDLEEGLFYDSCDGIEGFENIQEVIMMEQNSVAGRTSRANAATMCKAYDDIRELYSDQGSARKLGLKAGDFSFNIAGGRCEVCEGRGYVNVEMQFLSDISLVCESCQGRKFQERVLEVKYKGKSIDEVLEMSVDEGMLFFKDIAKITRKLSTLLDVGLGYLSLGQATSSLSGGEFQRLLLSTYLSRQRSKKALHRLFIFDEPTVGLHMQDVGQLMSALRRLVKGGDSVVVIEHNGALISGCDYEIELGPEGGPGGGRLVFEGKRG